MTDVRTIITDWYRVAEEHQDDPFFAFIALWIAFNAHYVSTFHDFTDPDARVKDHKYVKRFAQDRANVQLHRRLLATSPEYHDAVAKLAERGVTDVISGETHLIERMEDLLAVAEAVYQVRCNLFHGGKFRDDERDQQLTSASYTIVNALLRNVVT